MKLFLLLLLVATVADAQVKQWVDKDGVTHYENQPPPPSELDRVAKRPGEQQASLDGLVRAGVIKNIERYRLFDVPFPAIIKVNVGAPFYKLSKAAQEEALFVALRQHPLRDYPKGDATSIVVADDSSKKVIGYYSVGEGFKPPR